MTGWKFGPMIVAVCAFMSWAAENTSQLSSKQQQTLSRWLHRNPQYRVATDPDCECDSDIRERRKGYGGVWKPSPNYQPYVAVGDFNSDGLRDFAVAVINDSQNTQRRFMLLVFNSGESAPAFTKTALDLRGHGFLWPSASQAIPFGNWQV